MIINSQYQDLKELLNANGGNHFKVDLGCGFVKPSGFIGLDDLSGYQSQIPNHDNAPDILIDLNQAALPFPDDSCEEVRASHFLEHSNVMHILDEVHRILKMDGVFLFVVPYANSAEGMYPGHNIFFTEKWFHNNIVFQEKYEIISETYFPSDYWSSLPWLVKLLIPFSFARKFFFNACWQMMIHAKPKKHR